MQDYSKKILVSITSIIATLFLFTFIQPEVLTKPTAKEPVVEHFNSTIFDQRQDPFIGEVTMFSGNFAPRGWTFCHGQLLSISDHSALFSVLGTVYGGDGRSTFALPDLRGRLPVHPGGGRGLSRRSLGEEFGAEKESPQFKTTQIKTTSTGGDVMAVEGLQTPISNMQPALGVNYIIALEGIYPPRS